MGVEACWRTITLLLLMLLLVLLSLLPVLLLLPPLLFQFMLWNKDSAKTGEQYIKLSTATINALPVAVVQTASSSAQHAAFLLGNTHRWSM